MKRLLFHLAVLGHHFFCAYFFSGVDFSNVVEKTVLNMNSVRGSFITGWNFAFQTAYFSACFVEDLVRLNRTSKASKIQKETSRIKTLLFTSIVFPVSCFVCIAFWIFFTYNRELVYPAAIDAQLPLWFNHSLHTTIIVTVLVEMFLAYRPYPKTKTAMITLNIFMFSYYLCVFVTYIFKNVWVYPILDDMNWPQRIVFALLQNAFCSSLFVAGSKLNTAIWGDTKQLAVNGTSPQKLK